MNRFLITQSLVSAWAYTFDCYEAHEEEAVKDFMRVLNREPAEQTDAIQNGILFENAVYAETAGLPRPSLPEWENGIAAISRIIRGAQTQVKLSRPLEVDGTEYLVYGVLDALKAGIIYDVKFKNKRFSVVESDPGEYGKYLNSPQHSFYFYLVPEAIEFQYLLSDGDDLYIETYHREQTRSVKDIISEFSRSIQSMGLWDTYREKWAAK